MAYVYGEAYLVIAAAYAKDGNGGLYAPRQPAHHVEFKTSAGDSIKALIKYVSKWREEHAVWRKNEEFWEIDSLPLLSRAWVFQEKMLAKRTIYFTAHELVWECGTYIKCECGELQDQGVYWLEYKPGESIKTDYQYIIHRGSDVDRLVLWCYIIAHYSARGITYHTDRLPALASIAKQIGNNGAGGLLGRYLCGLWEVTLPSELLWSPDFKGDSQFSQRKKYNPTHVRSSNMRIPSWSWLPIEGRVGILMDGIRTLVRITDIDYRLVGDDPYGECEHAAITIVGLAVPVDVFTRQRDGKSELVAWGKRCMMEGLLLGDTQPFEYSDEELSKARLVALRFGSCKDRKTPGRAMCLVLRQEQEGINVYRRIGLVKVDQDMFRGVEEESIVLV